MNQPDDPHWIDNLTDEDVCHRLRLALESILPLEIDGITLERPAEILSYTFHAFDSMDEDERLALYRAALKHIYAWDGVQ